MSRLWLCTLVFAAAAYAQDDRTMRVYSLSGLVPTVRHDFRRMEEDPFRLLGAYSHRDGVIEWEREEPSANESVVSELVTEVARGASVRSVVGGQSLLVTASADQHKRIAQLLDLLHNQCGTPFELDVRYLSVPAREMDADLRLRLASGLATAADWKRITELDKKHGGRGGVVSAPHGRWAEYRATRRIQYMPEFDVEIAQGASVADPILMNATDGVRAMMRPFLLQDGNVLVHVVASAGEINRLKRFRIAAAPSTSLPDEPMSDDFGNLEQVDFNGCATATTLVLKPGGGPRVLVFGTPDEERWEILTFGVKRAPKPAAAGTFTVLPVGALTRDTGGFFVGFNPGDERGDAFLRMACEEEPPALIGGDAVEELLQEGMKARGQKGFLYQADWLHGGAYLVRSGAAEARMLQATVGALERALIRPADVRIVFVTGSTTPDLAAVVGVVQGSVLPGVPGSFAAYRQVEFVPDYDVEVAQQARIADPVSRAAYAGVFANMRLSRRGPRAYRLSLEMRVSALPKGVEDVLAASPELPPMQRAVERTRRQSAQIDVLDGGNVVIDLGANPFTPDEKGRLFAVVSVKGG